MASWQISSVSGGKITPGTVSSSALEDGIISARHIQAESINTNALQAECVTAEKLAAASITADKISAGAITADKLSAGAVTAETIDADSVTTAVLDSDIANAQIANIVDANIGTADIGFAQIRDADMQNLIAQDAVTRRYYIEKLQVDNAQLVNATVANLVIKASDGNYYRLDVASDGSISPVKVSPSASEIASGQSGNASIIETDLTVSDLGATNLKAVNALIDKLTADRIDVSTLFAREAFIDKLLTSKILYNGSLTIEAAVDSAQTAADDAASDAAAARTKAAAAQTAADSAVTVAENAHDAATTVQKTAVVSTVTHYLLSSKKKGITADTAGWTTEPQVPTKKLKYLWIYYTYTLYDGSVVDSTPTLNGTDAVTVSDAVMQYYRSTSDESLSGGAWTATVPEYRSGTYIWSRMMVTTSDGGTLYLSTAYSPELSREIGLDTVTDAMFDAIDGIGAVYVQADAPEAVVNDVWVDTSNQKVFRAVSVSSEGVINWQDITGRGFAQSLISAAAAADMADNKLQTYCCESVPLVSSTSEIVSPGEGDMCMMTVSGVLRRYRRSSSGTWTVYQSDGDVCMVNDDGVLSLYQFGTSWNLLSLQVGDLWINSLSSTTVYRWSGASWIEADSGLDPLIDEIRSIRTTAETQEQRVKAIEETAQHIVADTEGLHIRNDSETAEMLLTSAAMHIELAGEEEHYSEFSTDYVRFGKYKLRLTADGGMAFIYDEVSST